MYCVRSLFISKNLIFFFFFFIVDETLSVINAVWHATCEIQETRRSSNIDEIVSRFRKERNLSEKASDGSDPSGILHMKAANRQQWLARIRRDRARSSSNSDDDAGPWVDRRPRKVTFRRALRKLSMRARNRYPAAADAYCIMRAAAAQTQIRIPFRIPAARRKCETDNIELPSGRRRTRRIVGRSPRKIASLITRCRAVSGCPGKRSCVADASGTKLTRLILRRRTKRRDREPCRRSVKGHVRNRSVIPRS